MKHWFTRTLKAGDLIAVPYNNYLHPGIFIGYGKTGTVQYYNLRGFERPESKDYVRKRVEEGKLWKDYINRTLDNCIAKIDPDETQADLRVWYEELRYLLQQKGKI